jgi:hypothetical protein
MVTSFPPRNIYWFVISSSFFLWEAGLNRGACFFLKIADSILQEKQNIEDTIKPVFFQWYEFSKGCKI